MIGVPLCIVLGVCCLSKKSKRPVQTRIVATAPFVGATTIVTSGQAGTSTTAPVQYPQQPAYEDSQLSGPSAPPLYPGAAVFPQAAQVRVTIQYWNIEHYGVSMCKPLLSYTEYRAIPMHSWRTLYKPATYIAYC